MGRYKDLENRNEEALKERHLRWQAEREMKELKEKLTEANAKLKLLDIANVSQQRELLIGFLEWQGQNKYNGDTDEEIADWYLKHKDN